MSGNRFRIDLRGYRIYIRSERSSHLGGEIAIRFKAPTAIIHVGVMALVASEHKRLGDTGWVSLGRYQDKVAILAKNSKRQLANPYPAIRGFWNRAFQLSPRAHEVFVSGQRASRGEWDEIRSLMSELFESTGSAQASSLKLRFNNQALWKWNITSNDFDFAGLQELVDRVEETSPRLKQEAGQLALPTGEVPKRLAHGATPVSQTQAAGSEARATIEVGEATCRTAIAVGADTGEAHGHGLTPRTVSQSKSAPIPGEDFATPHYWLQRGLDLLADLKDLDQRGSLRDILGGMAYHAGCFDVAERLDAESVAEAFNSLLPPAKKAAKLWNIAKTLALRGNELASQRLLAEYANAKSAELAQIGIWTEAPGGLPGNLVPYLATGYVERRKTKEARALMPRFERYAKKRVLEGPREDKWQASELFAKSYSRLATGRAAAHLNWMVDNGYELGFSAYPLENLIKAYLESGLPKQAFSLTRHFACQIENAERGYGAWLTCLSLGKPHLSRKAQRNLLAAAIKGVLGEPNIFERPIQMAEVAKNLARSGLEEFSREVASKTQKLLHAAKRNRSKVSNELRSDYLSCELLTRIELCEAGLLKPDKKIPDDEMDWIVSTGRRIIQKCSGIDLRTVAWFLADHDRIEEAIEIAFHQPATFLGTGIVRRLLLAGNYTRLNKLYGQMLNPHDKIILLLEISVALWLADTEAKP